MTLEQADGLAKERLSEKRYKHVQGVVRAAKNLALRHGADPQKAQLAAWLHDIVKECSREELLQILSQDAIIAESTTRRPIPVWHGPAGAVYAKHQLGVDDPEILSAIECHTTGKPDMSTLDKVVFLADATSEERSFPGVGKLRQTAKKNLDQAARMAMEENLAYLEGKGKPLDSETVRALEYMRGNHPNSPRAGE